MRRDHHLVAAAFSDRWRVALCVCALGLAVGIPFIGLGQSRPGAAPPSGYGIGDRLDWPVEVLPEGRPAVLVFGSAACRACRDAAEGLRAVLAAVREQSRESTMRFVTPTPTEQIGPEIEYATGLGFAATDVVSMAPGAVQARLMPTIVVVSAARQVVFAKQGSLDGVEIRRIAEMVSERSH